MVLCYEVILPLALFNPLLTHDATGRVVDRQLADEQLVLLQPHQLDSIEVEGDLHSNLEHVHVFLHRGDLLAGLGLNALQHTGQQLVPAGLDPILEGDGTPNG